MQFSRFYNTNLPVLFLLFPTLFTYKGAGIWLFSVLAYSIFIWSYFFHVLCVSPHHYFPKPQIPASPKWERRACIWTKFSDQWHVLISSALVSFSCLTKHWPFPPSICLIPIVPKCTSPYSPEEKNKHNSPLSLQQYRHSDKSRVGFHQTPSLLTFPSQVILFPSVLSVAVLWLFPTASCLAGGQARLLPRVNAA